MWVKIQRNKLFHFIKKFLVRYFYLLQMIIRAKFTFSLLKDESFLHKA